MNDIMSGVDPLSKVIEQLKNLEKRVKELEDSNKKK